MKKITALVIALLLFVSVLAACSSGQREDSSVARDSHTGNSMGSGQSNEFFGSSTKGVSDGGYEADYKMAEAAPQSSVDTPADVSLLDPNRKLIRTATLEVESTSFDSDIDGIESLCLSYGGFIENSNVTGESLTNSSRQLRRATYTFRIPSVRYNEFIGSVGGICNVTNKTQNSQDITESYYDTESRLRVLRMRQERLEKLLQTEQDSKAIINYENSLSDTLYEIERLTGTLRKYDALVDYSSITVHMQEVVKYTAVTPLEVEPEGAWERIVAGFNNSVKALTTVGIEFGIWLLSNILYLLIFVAVILLILLLLRHKGRKAKEAVRRRNARHSSNATDPQLPLDIEKTE